MGTQLASGNVDGLRIGIPKQCFGDGLNKDVKSQFLLLLRL